VEVDGLHDEGTAGTIATVKLKHGFTVRTTLRILGSHIVLYRSPIAYIGGWGL
jgi:hypothetical protein